MNRIVSQVSQLRLSYFIGHHVPIPHGSPMVLPVVATRLVPEIEAILADADRSLIADMADRSRCQSGNGGERLCSVSSNWGEFVES